MYLLTQDNAVIKFPYTLEELRADNPLTSFPLDMSAEELAGWGVFAVEVFNPPSFSESTESIEAMEPTFADGKWVREWRVVPADAEEVERRTSAKALMVRAERNNYLANSDYTQLPDFPSSPELKAALTQFRQELRDLPQQPGFPWDVTWPSFE
ncbi:MAG: hypothetical protein FJ211_10360 [Ignavibacteria bacterium]|nr:hypothetical protein [Ignavibacteria bacterium]